MGWGRRSPETFSSWFFLMCWMTKANTYFQHATRKLNNFKNEKTHLLRPLMMKAFPECWVSTFFITLYSSWLSCNTNVLVSTGHRSEVRMQCRSRNWNLPR